MTISPSRDTTLYQTTFGADLANGSGERLFAGRTEQGVLRRGLIYFDVSAFVPPGAVITNVTLQLNLSRTKDKSEDVTLHRVLASWGEGTSNAPQEEGQGDLPSMGDATWNYRFYPTSIWASAGSDFRATASALTTVTDREGIFSWSSAGMVADVQLWLTNSGTNFGWLIRGGEGVNKTAKRFDTREVATIANRPQLVVQFTPPASVGACCLPDGSCATMTSNQCATANGSFKGIGSQCATNPCPPPTGACCLPNGACETLTSNQCAAVNGTYQGNNVPCISNLCPVVLTPFVDPLPIPTPVAPVSGTIGGAAYYEVSMLQVTQKLHRDLPPTIVWAYGNAFPGPLIEATVREPVTVKWINNLRDTNGQLRTNHYLPVDLCLHGPDMEGATPRTVVHLHGGKVSQADDGYPEDTFLPGQSRTNFYGNDQPPGTIWFHDHALGITRLNVYMGLAGLYLLRDAFENSLGLPAGENEIPLAIQDRKFKADGSLSYPEMWHEHFFGDTILVNGKVWPVLTVKRGKYRFRVLNGSTSRTYTLALSTGAAFHQIGTDAGLLPAPVPLTNLTLMPGERADVVMDFSGYAAGTTLFLTNSAPAPFPGSPGVGVVPNVMKFVVTNILGHTAPLPASLRAVEPLYETNALKHREFTLRKTADPCTGSKWLINDLGWHDITEFPILGTTEVWSFINRSGVSHPMHLHLVLMQVLDRQPFTVSNNVVIPTGPRVPPPANEAGWKDTVAVGPNEICRIIARFDGFPGKFPYHCHILEHEDHEMMRQFQVVPPPEFTSIRRSGNDVILQFRPASNSFHFVERRELFGSGSWLNVTSGLPGTSASAIFIDAGGATSPSRFYRLGVQP